jgi:AcrR family transcriptional regulator
MKTTDRRVQRTRRQLHDALLARILEKRYDSITVQEILDRADVGRSTFYSHFRNKDALLVCGFETFKTSLESASRAPAAARNPSYEQIIAYSLPIFEHAGRYQDVHRALHGSTVEALVRRNLHSVFFDVIGKGVESEMRRRGLQHGPISPELLTRFLVSTQIAVLNWWIDARSPTPVAHADASYRRLVVPVLASIFE